MCYSALVKKNVKFLAGKFAAVPVMESFDDYARMVAQNPTKHAPLETPRIFPGHYAPIVYTQGGKQLIEPMRYSAFPPSHIKDPHKYTTFNARRDNLTSPFWAEMFQKHHGVIVLEGFFEWVKVAKLVKGGVVTLDQVKAEFAAQSEARRERLKGTGKPYRPTPTELKDPMLRDIVIQFQPKDEKDLLVPVIFSVGHDLANPEAPSKGFAIITDDPPNEVRLAGHDRCPVTLSEDAVKQWLQPGGRSADDLDRILGQGVVTIYGHELPEAA